MLPPAAVVFDLDGTLIDSRGDIAQAVNHALAQTGRPAVSEDDVVRMVGDGARVLCARAAKLPEHSAEVDQILELFTGAYVARPVEHTRWARGAQQALDTIGAMPGVSLALCTNKARVITEAVLSGLGVRTRFRAVVAGGDTPEKKPAPGPLLQIAKLLELSPNRLVMVGDGPQDIESARRAGARAIATIGFSPRDRLIESRPDVLIETLDELPEVIKRWREATVRVVGPRG
jgi:2-phosphoglycolate phosphatase